MVRRTQVSVGLNLNFLLAYISLRRIFPIDFSFYPHYYKHQNFHNLQNRHILQTKSHQMMDMIS